MNWMSYPAYKPSGVEWLGEVPGHWAVWKIAHGFELIGSGTTPSSDETVWYDGTIPWITTSELRENIITTTEKSVTYDAVVTFSALKKFPKGSLAIAMYGATIGRLGILGIEATTNQACCVMSGGNVFTVPFVYYWMQAFKKSIILLASGGGQPNISQDKIRSLKIPCPQIPEQQSIAAFLDRETGRIDTLLAKKERLIELLREKRSALISHAVTKGIDPSVKLKPSGVEWFGDVPEHWEILALKRIVDIPVTDGPHETPEILDEGIPFVSAEAIKNDKIDFTKIRGFISIEDHKKYSLKYKPHRDDIYVIKSGATTGNIAMVETDDEFNIWSPLAAIRPNQKVSFPRFLFHFVKSKEFFTSIQLGWSFGTQQNIGMSVIENLFVTLPPLPEQEAIAAFLDRETGKIDALIAKVEDAIVKLKEYRTALISAAVTGKIDIREAA